MSPDGRQPVHRIADDLREQIASGALPPGGKLPANRELATQYGVTRMTASRAVATLVAEGLVETRHGSGAYVREAHPVRRLGPDRYARHKWQVTTVDAFAADTPATGDSVSQQEGQTQEVALVKADKRIAESLGVETGTDVYERARVVTREGVATHTMTSYYRPNDVAGTPIVNPRPGIAGQAGGFQVLNEQGLPPHEVTEELSARMPTPDEVQVLALNPGEPVVEVHRVTRTAEARPIEYARGVHVASRFRWAFTYEIPD